MKLPECSLKQMDLNRLFIDSNSCIMKIVSGRNYEARLSPLVEMIAFCYGSQSLEIHYCSLPKVFWAGKIAEFYETGEYSVTRKFWTSTSDRFRRDSYVIVCAREERVWKIENN